MTLQGEQVSENGSNFVLITQSVVWLLGCAGTWLKALWNLLKVSLKGPGLQLQPRVHLGGVAQFKSRKTPQSSQNMETTPASCLAATDAVLWWKDKKLTKKKNESYIFVKEMKCRHQIWRAQWSSLQSGNNEIKNEINRRPENPLWLLEETL